MGRGEVKARGALGRIGFAEHLVQSEARGYATGPALSPFAGHAFMRVIIVRCHCFPRAALVIVSLINGRAAPRQLWADWSHNSRLWHDCAPFYLKTFPTVDGDL